MKKILFPLATALMVGCLSLQSVMAKKPQVTNNYDRDHKICTDSVKNIKINPPNKVYSHEETKVYRYKDDFSFSYPNNYYIEKIGAELIIYNPYGYKLSQCLENKNIMTDEGEDLPSADISIIKAPNLQQYKNSMESYAYSDFRTKKSNNGYQIATYIGHGMNDKSCVAFEHPHNLYLVKICGLSHPLNARSEKLEPDDKPAFNLIVSKFCFRQPNNDTLQDCGIWNNLKRDEVAQRLDELIKNSNLVAQEGLNLCGPAAFFQIWLKRDPEAVKRYVTELYNTGSSHIGNLKITASEKLRSQNFDDVKKAVKEIQATDKEIQATDWMMMTALRSTNYPETYKGTDNTWWQTLLSSTSPSTVVDWLKATGLYREIKNETFIRIDPTAIRYATLKHAQDLGDPSTQDIILSIKPGILGGDNSGGHFIVLEETPTLVEGDKVKLKYWTWGYSEAQPLTLSKEQFEKAYFGGIVATPKK
jgi:hypothetical protein